LRLSAGGLKGDAGKQQIAGLISSFVAMVWRQLSSPTLK
jgi:hypothetical protein